MLSEMANPEKDFLGLVAVCPDIPFECRAVAGYFHNIPLCQLDRLGSDFQYGLRTSQSNCFERYYGHRVTSLSSRLILKDINIIMSVKTLSITPLRGGAIGFSWVGVKRGQTPFLTSKLNDVCPLFLKGSVPFFHEANFQSHPPFNRHHGPL